MDNLFFLFAFCFFFSDWLDDDCDWFCRASTFTCAAASAFRSINNRTHHVFALYKLDCLERTVFVADGAVLVVCPSDAFLCVHNSYANRARMLLLY